MKSRFLGGGVKKTNKRQGASVTSNNSNDNGGIDPSVGKIDLEGENIRTAEPSSSDSGVPRGRESSCSRCGVRGKPKTNMVRKGLKKLFAHNKHSAGSHPTSTQQQHMDEPDSSAFSPSHAPVVASAGAATSSSPNSSDGVINTSLANDIKGDPAREMDITDRASNVCPGEMDSGGGGASVRSTGSPDGLAQPGRVNGGEGKIVLGRLSLEKGSMPLTNHLREGEKDSPLVLDGGNVYSATDEGHASLDSCGTDGDCISSTEYSDKPAKISRVTTDPGPSPPLTVPMTSFSRNRTTGHKPLRGRRKSTMKDKIFDDPAVVRAYDSIPVLELNKLPRGGVSMETQAVGRVQFGIPPETIKDSMRKGLGVPSVYIVPVERFCREMGPALGINLAEFEFPAYFNFFVQRKRCTLIVDSDDAELNIRRVFSETLLGPIQFRRLEDPIGYEEEDFSKDFPREAIPNFQKEFKHFRIMPDGTELVLETLLKFKHFCSPGESGAHEGLGVPPPWSDYETQDESDIGASPPNEDTQNRLSLQIASSSPNLAKPTSEEEKRNRAGSIPNHRRSSELVTKPRRNQRRESYVRTTDDLPENALATGGDSNEHPCTVADAEEGRSSKPWTYAKAKWIGDVATVYPEDATPDQIASGSVRRVEIFKMPGGTEYIVHDINENNIIIGKARFSGNVRVSEFMSVDGFDGRDFEDEMKSRRKSAGVSDDEDEADEEDDDKLSIPESVLPPTFHPPSFGVTILGNSHGFDKSGSVSGYVLWINGRGVMIDPPPYSSATLEREGIRPRNIVGIILTHCHADHDAGAFQKVLTGTQVVVITTPTIYKSFIRKYAALSALSPALLRHSHRHKPAIIGTPLRFQGATFHFIYTLHTIPCIGFRVEWRGRSMVFTGDHFNNPEALIKLEESGVLSKARHDDLRNLPLQETDLLLHEAGAPPIHTPLDVLLKLPPKVKRRLFVVHTSALPKECELKVAPTGTSGTIRLDRLNKPSGEDNKKAQLIAKRNSIFEDFPFEEQSIVQSLWSASEYESNSLYGDGINEEELSTSFSNRGRSNMNRMSSFLRVQEPPLVSLRPTSSTDAWFILNLLSAVPFLSSLSYASTMEVLETARVDAFCMNDVVVPADRRRDVLCVVWEGTCMEREQSTKTIDKDTRTRIVMRNQRNNKGDRRTSTFQVDQGKHRPLTENEVRGKKRVGAVWHAGDWTGPRSLQPEKRLSGESSTSDSHDIVAMSRQGVKVITVEFSNLHAILKSGSQLYRKYLARRAKLSHLDAIPETVENEKTRQVFEEAMHCLNVIELIYCNSALRKLSAVQKRHLESLAEGPMFFHPGQRLWRSGAPVDKAFIIVAGTASFVPRRRNAGSVKATIPNLGEGDRSDGTPQIFSLGETMRVDAIKAIKQLGHSVGDEEDEASDSSISSEDCELDSPADEIRLNAVFSQHAEDDVGFVESNDYEKLSKGLQKRADSVNAPQQQQPQKCDSSSTDADGSVHDYTDSTIGDDHTEESLTILKEALKNPPVVKKHQVQKRRRSSRDRFANKVLGRLYSRRCVTAGLVFSRGHFLGDVSKMVAGLLSNRSEGDNGDDEMSGKYGFGEKTEGKSSGLTHDAPVGELIIHEKEGDQHTVHSSTLAAGKDGCVVMVFPKASLIPFLDEYPGLLLSLLGTQVVV